MKKKRGPKQKNISWEQFDKLCEIGNTKTQICRFFGISLRTLERRVFKKYKQTTAEIITGGKYGAKKKEVLWETFNDLCELHCTKKEISSFLQMDEDTLSERIKEEYGITFSVLYKQKSKSGNVSLRRAQKRLALDGNATMLIWLGKNHLGQSDQQQDNQDLLSDKIQLMKEFSKMLPG